MKAEDATTDVAGGPRGAREHFERLGFPRTGGVGGGCGGGDDE